MRVEPTMALAVELIDAVTRGDVDAAQHALDRADTFGLCVVLAAMNDPDRPLSVIRSRLPRLLRALDSPSRRRAAGLKPCGTHAAHNRHKNRGEEPCEACKQGEREYQARRDYIARHVKPPASDVDEVAVERACAGERVRLSSEERHLAILRLTEQGLSVREIAQRIGVTGRSVTRHRAQLRDAGMAKADAAQPLWVGDQAGVR